VLAGAGYVLWQQGYLGQAWENLQGRIKQMRTTAEQAAAARESAAA
jgi:hypothetical protein